MEKKYYENRRHLAENIKYYRKFRHYTQEQLADQIGIHRTHISKIETFHTGVTLDLLFALAEALQVPPYKLLEPRK
jgi:transcriptional regulator with XRE-family HTH domain